MLRRAVRLQVVLLQVVLQLAGLRVGRRQVESEPMKPLELPQRLVLLEAPEVQRTVPPRPLATVLLEQELAEQELAEQAMAEQAMVEQAMVEQAMVEQRQRAAQVPLEQVRLEQVLVRLRREQPPREQPELPEPVRLELPRLESVQQQPLVQLVPLQLVPLQQVQQRQAELRRSEPAHRLDWAERMELRSEYSFSNLTVQRNGDDTPASNPECSEKMLLKTE